MLTKKEGQTCRNVIGSRVFKLLQSAMCLLDLPFSGCSNARYGLKDAAAIIAAMCENRRYFRGAANHLQILMKCPKSDWLLRKIKTITPELMASRCDEMLAFTVNSIFKKMDIRALGPVVIAIDKHLIPRHDKPADMRHLTKNKAKNGTHTFETYITAYVVAGNIGFNLACGKVTRDEFDPYFVRKIIPKMLYKGTNNTHRSAGSRILFRRCYEDLAF